jgi:hypothetical protein
MKKLTHKDFRKQYKTHIGTFYEYGSYRILEPRHNDERWIMRYGDIRIGAASDYQIAIDKVNEYRESRDILFDDAKATKVKNAGKDKETIKQLVKLCDELRRPYNNSKRHDLYEHANEVLNRLEEEDRI